MAKRSQQHKNEIFPGQDAVFTFMGDPLSHDPRPEAVKRIDTHAAVIFLAGKFAYKIKRAVRLPYLDFSTLDKRRAVCEHEVEINKRTAPDIYLGVIPIMRRTEGALAIGGAGEPVEWAVKMRRFSQTGLFDVLARKGELASELMTPLAVTIATMHANAPTVRRAVAARKLGLVIKSITASLGHAPPHLDAAAVKGFARAIRAAHRAQSALLDERAHKGYVRRCHGDLHLQNIVLIEGQPVLFDAIEFDEAIATIDIFYDLAFLLMDLWRRGLRAHANTLFNSYLGGDSARQPQARLRGLALLPLFLATRAGVRAMVTLDRLPFVTGAERKKAIAELTELFGLANAFLHPPKTRLIAVGGLSGTGKSTLAAALAPEIGAVPGALVIRSDVERKRLAGVSATTQLSSAHYTTAATGRVYRSLFAKAQVALAAGQCVILDAVFARKDQRDRAEQIAQKAGVPFTGLWLEAPDRQMIGRVEARKGDASDANAGVVRQQLSYETGLISWEKIDASGEPDGVKGRANGHL